MKYQTLKEAGYKELQYDLTSKVHYLLNLKTKVTEMYIANKYHASWGIVYKNTHLEFIGSIPLGE